MKTIEKQNESSETLGQIKLELTEEQQKAYNSMTDMHKKEYPFYTMHLTYDKISKLINKQKGTTQAQASHYRDRKLPLDVDVIPGGYRGRKDKSKSKKSEELNGTDVLKLSEIKPQQKHTPIGDGAKAVEFTTTVIIGGITFHLSKDSIKEVYISGDTMKLM